MSKSAEFDYTTKTESIENTVINILSVIAMGSALVFISGRVFGVEVLGYAVTAGQVARGVLTAKDIGHLITGKDINGNPLSEADKQAITSSLIVEASMLAVNSFSKLKHANKVNKVEVIEVGSKPNIKYDYDMIKNPGPLSKVEGQPAANFYGGKYNIEVFTEDRIYYRAGQDGKPLGQWFTSKPAESLTKVRIDTAVKGQ